MPVNEFIAHLCDQLRPLGPVSPRRMFGGYGLYLEGVMFGLVLHDCLYLKADELNLPAFQALGMEPFTYQRQGKTVRLSFHAPGAEVLEDREALLALTRQALAAAHRNKA